jgi:hypothetical protein
VRTSNPIHGLFYDGSSTAQLIYIPSTEMEGVCVNTEYIKDLRDNYD